MPVGTQELAAVALGITYAALPGVVNTEAVRRGLRDGFTPALSVQVGALLGDALWAVIALTGALLLLEHDAVALALGLLGAGFLFHLTRNALLSALRGTPAEASQAAARGSLVTGVIFSLANPAGLAFWSGLGGGMLGANGDHSVERAIGFLALFVVGALGWGVGMSALVAWGRRFATARLFRIIDAVCALILGYFGLRLLWTTIQRYGKLFLALPRALTG